MTIDPLAFVTILGMAAVTYATRAGGPWLIGRLTSSPRVDAGLRHLPGAILIAIVAPALLDGGLAALPATLAIVLVAARTNNLLLAIVVGILVVWISRLLL